MTAEIRRAGAAEALDGLTRGGAAGPPPGRRAAALALDGVRRAAAALDQVASRTEDARKLGRLKDAALAHANAGDLATARDQAETLRLGAAVVAEMVRLVEAQLPPGAAPAPAPPPQPPPPAEPREREAEPRGRRR